jgi:hypothetical protein
LACLILQPPLASPQATYMQNNRSEAVL